MQNIDNSMYTYFV